MQTLSIEDLERGILAIFKVCGVEVDELLREAIKEHIKAIYQLGYDEGLVKGLHDH